MPSGSPVSDASDVVARALTRYFPPPYTGQLPNCGWYNEGGLALGGDSDLVFDAEAQRLGTNRWSESEPYIWVGDRQAAIEAFGAVEVIEASDGTEWLILYDADWLGGTHYGQQLKRHVTPGGNQLWYLDDLEVQFPGEGECVQREGEPGQGTGTATAVPKSNRQPRLQR